MRKVMLLLLMDSKTRKLFLESYFYLAWARILKSLPFVKVAPILGESMMETSFHAADQEKRILSSVSQSIQVMSKYTFWESQCLVRAIAAMKMLEKRHIESTLYLGTAKGENGEMIAHAWLRSGPFYITGAEEMDKFTVVGKFAKKNGGFTNG
ncbi:MAG: lasso peptide biosynthesis B2 protein [Bacillaceae bacterium]|nr:lasso peptide biosynthesis B2 protein [Bacillaceae bacterium]